MDDCPLTYAGITLYGTLDGGYGYETHGVPGNPSAGKVNYGIQKNSGNTHWLWSPNALGASVIGLKMEENIGAGWSLIGVVEAGFNPYSGMLINGPRSRADNNVNALANQTANYNSSRAGQWDNSQGFFGFSNPVYGRITFGRTNSLSLDALSSYDPVASTAFSPLGLFRFVHRIRQQPDGPSEHRLHLSVERREFPGRRAGAGRRVDLGNASNGQYQGQIGADFGDLSLDGAVNWTRDAVSLSSYSGSPPEGYDVNSVLKATLSNSAGLELMARYKCGPFRFYGGYIFARLMNPSDDYPNGFPTIAEGIFVPPGAVTSNAYTSTGSSIRCGRACGIPCGAISISRPASTIALKMTICRRPGVCTGTGTSISSSKCAGSAGAVSFLIEYKPVERIDVYGGVMISNVWGGLANGHLYTQNVDPTVGLRIRF